MIDKKRLPVLVVAAVAAAGLAFLARDSLRAPLDVRTLPKAPGRAAAPDASVSRPVSLHGGVTRDLSRPPGKLLIVHFWATWCPPCVKEFPALLQFWKEYGKKPGLDLLAVSVDEEWKTVDDWVKTVGAGGIPVALDPRRATAKAFGTEKFPETYVLSPSGQVVDKFVGPVSCTSPSLRKRIDELLETRAAAPAGG
jgi:cytochrome c biogenesis protein CcmG/thiol:disulfide interchange protein DsbE